MVHAYFSEILQPLCQDWLRYIIHRQHCAMWPHRGDLEQLGGVLFWIAGEMKGRVGGRVALTT